MRNAKQGHVSNHIQLAWLTFDIRFHSNITKKKINHHLLRNNLFVILSVFVYFALVIIISLLSKINIFLHLLHENEKKKRKKLSRNQRSFNNIIFLHTYVQTLMNSKFFNIFLAFHILSSYV